MKKIEGLSDLVYDDKNLNAHTPRGLAMVEQSLTRCGAGRSVLADRNGKLIAGNLTAEAARALGAEDIILVPTDGKRLVVVQRLDLDLDTDEQAKQLAIADNRTAEVSLNWTADELAALDETKEAGDISWLFRKDELDFICGKATDTEAMAELRKEAKEHSSTTGEKFQEHILTLVFSSAKEKAQAVEDLEQQGYQFKEELI